jgi:hypothetical protein
MAKSRRRQAGEGGISEYATKAGPRFLIKYPVQREDGTKRVVLKRGFITRKDAAAALRAEIRKVEMGEWVEPSKQRLDAYLAEWVQGQRLSPSTVSSYRKSIRLHIDPYLGAVPIARLTGTAVNAWMRTLETSGRADRRGGLSARTVRYVYTILRAALADAVKHGRLSVNPTNRSTPPSPSEARPPEMQAWTARELGRFLRWTRWPPCGPTERTGACWPSTSSGTALSCSATLTARTGTRSGTRADSWSRSHRRARRSVRTCCPGSGCTTSATPTPRCSWLRESP